MEIENESFADVVTIFNELHPNREPLSKSTVSKTLKRFIETGGVTDRSKNGNPISATGKENSFNVMFDVIKNKKCSMQQLALNHDMSRWAMKKITKQAHFRQFRIQLLQELNEDDFDRRIQFCEIMMDRMNQNGNIKNQILFADDATFSLRGEVNRHNCRFWSDANPHWMMEIHTQRPQKVPTLTLRDPWRSHNRPILH